MAKPTKKRTPTDDPNILNDWQLFYSQLINSYPKWRALEIIANRYGGLHASTVEYHLFPERKEKQKKYPSKAWAYEKQNPVIHKKRIAYKAKYMAARRHIDELIKKSYEKAAPQESMTLEDLACAIEDISGIFFQTSTIMGLNDRFEASKGYPLLTTVSGDQMTRYKLSQQAKQYV